MFEIVRYQKDYQKQWDGFVKASRQGTFLFLRDYMDYHSDRFKDHSLLFLLNGNIYALLPAHEEERCFISHNGLTYGGLITTEKATAENVRTLFSELNAYLKGKNFLHVVYKPVPHIYCSIPSEEDLYAIFWTCHAHLTSRKISTTINFAHQLKLQRLRRRELKKAQERGVIVQKNGNLKAFWKILEDNLEERYHASPVHTLEEIYLLQSRFPQNIILYTAEYEGKVVAGVMIYISDNVVHPQYSSANEAGHAIGAADAIYHQIVTDYQNKKAYLDFGTSNEQNGSYLNTGLIAYKEGFGGRATTYDTYEWDL